jgi:hypothetical protein
MPRFASDKDHAVFGEIVFYPEILLTRLLRKLMYWNRKDLILDVQNQFITAKKTDVRLATAVFPDTWGIANDVRQSEGSDAVIARVGSTIDRGTWSWETNRAHHPRAIALIPVHRGSAVSFIEGLIGHSFTGIVRIQKEGAALPYKIFLFPTQPSEGRSGQYPTRPHDENVRGRIYKETSSPIKVEGLPSHTQLAEMIKSKETYEECDQTKGDFIGFSVIKGDGGKFPNRYSFTSFSSNKSAFLVKPGERIGLVTTPAIGGGGSVPQEWANAIRTSVDKLLALETEALTTWGSKERGIAAMNKTEWRRIVHRYWT